jgi:hypothetical protein
MFAVLATMIATNWVGLYWLANGQFELFWGIDQDLFLLVQLLFFGLAWYFQDYPLELDQEPERPVESADLPSCPSCGAFYADLALTRWPSCGAILPAPREFVEDPHLAQAPEVPRVS